MARSWSLVVERLPRARLILAAACVMLAWGLPSLLPEVAGVDHEDVTFVARRIVLALALALASGGAFVSALRSPRFTARFVAPSTAEDLARLRIVIASVTMLVLAFEPIPWTTRLPAALYEPVGLMAALEWIPGFASVRRDSVLLCLLWGTGITACAAAVAGFHTRRSVLVGAVIALVCGGILRGYTRVFHVGLLPSLLLLVLAFTPCGDAYAFDARAGRTANASASDYAHGRFAVLANVGIAYAAAGFSKLVRGGLAWWDADNMHRMLFESSLEDMAFDFDLPLRHTLPDAFVSTMGSLAVIVELAMPLILVRGLRFRYVLPLLAIGMHLGILFFQNILFPDLLLLDTALCAMLWTERDAEPIALETTPRPRTKHLAPLLVGTPLLIAIAGIEAYPLTAWPMFSHADTSGIATYHRMHGLTEDGRAVPIDVTACYPSMQDARHRTLMALAIDGTRVSPAREALVTCAREQGGLRAVVVERVRFHFRLHPARTDVVARVLLPLDAQVRIATRSRP